MIARLKGVLDATASDSIVIDVNGVGYLVQCASSTLANLPAIGEPVSLHIETQVREDAITLLGFTSEKEREWFRLLNGVQGVGSKLALGILGTLGAQGVADAIALQDKNAFARTSGVGPKLAGRIANELKDKAPKGFPTSQAASDEPSDPAQPDMMDDALSALINLGYRQADAAAALAKARREHGGDGTLDALIRNSLRELSA